MSSSTDPTPASPGPLAGREILIAVCGGIAAYKVADVVSKLVQQGAGITVCMTDSAQKFVTPLTFQALSGRPVRTSTWDPRRKLRSPAHFPHRAGGPHARRAGDGQCDRQGRLRHLR